MTPATEFHIEPLADNQLQSRLVGPDSRTGGPIEGQVLEAQFHTPAGELIITSDGNPFEEVLHFTLLDGDLKVLDAISLGQIYHSGLLRELQVVGEDTLQFHFFGEETWRLMVSARPRWALPPWPGSAIRRAGNWLRSSRLHLERE